MQLLTFTLGEVKYGIPIEHVQSIEERVQVVGIPKTLPCVQSCREIWLSEREYPEHRCRGCERHGDRFRGYQS